MLGINTKLIETYLSPDFNSCTSPSFLRSPANQHEANALQLQTAIYSGLTAKVDSFVNDSNLLTQCLPNGELPLNYAIRLGHSEIVEKILLKHPTALSDVDSHNLTPIDHAFISNNQRIINTILGIKFNIDLKDVQERLLNKIYTNDLKNEKEFITAIEALCLPPKSENKAFEAAEKGDLSTITAMLEDGLDISMTTPEGWSLLHLAVNSGTEELVELLLKKGASTQLLTKHGLTPLHIAAAGNSRAIVQLLLQAGSDANALDQFGSSPLHYAVSNKDKAFSAQLLIEQKADVLLQNKLNISPLLIIAVILKMQSEGKDELKLSDGHVSMFTGIIASYIASYCGEYCGGYLSYFFSLIGNSVNIAPFLIASENSQTLAEKAALVGSIALYFFHESTFITDAIGFDIFPGLRVLAQVWKTYWIGKTAFKTIKASYRYRHLETFRPILNAVKVTANVMYVWKQLDRSLNYAFGPKLKNYFENKSEELQAQVRSKYPRDINFDKHYEKDFEALWNVYSLECQQGVLFDSLCRWLFVNQETARFQAEGKLSLPFGEITSETCSGKDLKTCINDYRLDPKYSRHASAILGVPLEASKSIFSRALRPLALKYHPDKNNSSDNLSKIINAAYDRCTRNPG